MMRSRLTSGSLMMFFLVAQVAHVRDTPFLSSIDRWLNYPSNKESTST